MMLPTKRYVGRGTCPHCSGPAKIRTVRTVSPTYQEHYLDCQDDEEDGCGWRGVASFVIERSIVPSRKPNPSINLPLAPPRRRSTGAPVPANDDAPPTSAVAL